MSIYDAQCNVCRCYADNRRTDIPKTWARISIKLEKEGWFNAEIKESHNDLYFCSQQCLNSWLLQLSNRHFR